MQQNPELHFVKNKYFQYILYNWFKPFVFAFKMMNCSGSFALPWSFTLHLVRTMRNLENQKPWASTTGQQSKHCTVDRVYHKLYAKLTVAFHCFHLTVWSIFILKIISETNFLRKIRKTLSLSKCVANHSRLSLQGSSCTVEHCQPVHQAQPISEHID